MKRGRALAIGLTAVVFGYSVAGVPQATLALFRDTETVPATFATAASFDTTAPVIGSAVVSKSVPYLPGFVRQGGTYHVYATVTDSGGSGLASVTASVTSLTTGASAVALVAGTYSIGGVSYTHRSAALTANPSLVAGAATFSVSAADGAGNPASAVFGVTIDNTQPAPSAIATANGGTTVARPEANDTVTFTFSEIVDPQSVLNLWTGLATSVVVVVTNAAGSDTLTVRNAGNTADLSLGTVSLGGAGYVAATRTFGATGTPSTMTMSGTSITVVLGTASGVGTTQAGNTTMTWTPLAAMTDRAGNACVTTTFTETGTADREF